MKMSLELEARASARGPSRAQVPETAEYVIVGG